MEKLRSSLLTLVLVLLLSLSAVAPASGSPTPLGTSVGGSICANTSWTPAGSPYTVTSNLLVCAGVTLTVQPGVVVKFNDNLGMAIDGTLVADGTAGQPILFTSSRATPVPGSWAYIKFNDLSQDATFDGSGNYVSGSILRYATVEYAGALESTLGAIWLDKASPFIDHSTIRNNSKSGTYAGMFDKESHSLRITNNVISNNSGEYGGGVRAYGAVGGNSSVTISDNTITGNSSGNVGGIQIDTIQASISGNTVRGNTASSPDWGRGGGIRVEYSSATITGNIIANNSAGYGGGGIYNPTGATISKNVIVGNSAPTGAGLWTAGSVTNDSIVRNGYSGKFSVNIVGATFDCNTVVRNGAGVRVESAASLANNNLYNNTSYELYNSSSSNVTAANNWWGTSDTSVIDSEIYDFFDNAAKGVVTYTPFLTGPALCAPPAPPTGLTAGAAPAVASPGALSLSWNPNTESDIGGYKVYWGTQPSFPYANVVDAGNVTNYVLNGLTQGVTYYLAVTAYENGSDGNGADESWFSQEISAVAGPGLDVSNVSCSPNLFNPSTGGSTTCGFTLNKTAWAVLIVLDKDYNLMWVSPFDPVASQYGAGSHSIPWAGQIASLASLTDGPYIPIIYAADADGGSDFGLDSAIHIKADNGQNPVVSNLTVTLAASPAAGAAVAVAPRTIAFDVDKYHTPMAGVLNSNGQWVRLLTGQKAYAGHDSFLWDGNDAGGNPVPTGTYWFLGIATDDYGRGAGCYTSAAVSTVSCFTFAPTATGRGPGPLINGDVPEAVRAALAGLPEEAIK